MSFGVVVLAAGEGKRLKTDCPKVLHMALGKPLLDWVLEAAKPLAATKTVVVVGHLREKVMAHLKGRPVEVVVQDPPRGTGDAFRVALSALEDCHQVLVLPGDAPLLTTKTLQRLLAMQNRRHASGTVLTARLPQPGAYGRVLRKRGRLMAIVEAKDATPQQLAVKEVNAGVYVFQLPPVLPLVEGLSADNAQKEYYITDLVAALVARGEEVATVTLEDGREMLGVNTRLELAQVSRALADRILSFWQQQGVTIVDPQTTWVEDGCQIGRDTVLEPGVMVRSGSILREGCWVGAHSVLEGVHLSPGSRVPPLSYLRGGS